MRENIETETSGRVQSDYDSEPGCVRREGRGEEPPIKRDPWAKRLAESTWLSYVGTREVCRGNQ